MDGMDIFLGVFLGFASLGGFGRAYIQSHQLKRFDDWRIFVVNIFGAVITGFLCLVVFGFIDFGPPL